MHVSPVLLDRGLTVVLDFPANTKRQREWFRELIDRAGAEHELHLIEVSDELCKLQLKLRSQSLGLPEGTKWTKEADFEKVTAFFDPPHGEEGFTIVRHDPHSVLGCG
jgi:hypothetical protein